MYVCIWRKKERKQSVIRCAWFQKFLFFFSKTITNRLTNKENNHSYCLQLFDVHCTYINRSFSGPIFRLCRSFSKGNCKTSFETSYGGKFWFSIWELPTHICIRNASIHFKIQIQKLIQQVGITNAHSLLVSQCLKLQNISNSSIMGLLFDTQGDTYLVDTFHQLFVSAKLKNTQFSKSA